ncbi:MAG: STAS domain-containing protein [Clostridia bacterium]|nr:STAS domain-containing protein [Clostridia bacterium]
MQEITLLARTPLTFGLAGEIDSQNADEFYAEVMEKYLEAPCDVVFDCAKLEFLDSTTLGTFVKLMKRVKEGGYRMVLRRLQPRLRKLFVICALDTIMEIEE